MSVDFCLRRHYISCKTGTAHTSSHTLFRWCVESRRADASRRCCTRRHVAYKQFDLQCASAHARLFVKERHAPDISSSLLDGLTKFALNIEDDAMPAMRGPAHTRTHTYTTVHAVTSPSQRERRLAALQAQYTKSRSL